MPLFVAFCEISIAYYLAIENVLQTKYQNVLVSVMDHVGSSSSTAGRRKNKRIWAPFEDGENQSIV